MACDFLVCVSRDGTLASSFLTLDPKHEMKVALL
jgi:hypothetical protein